MPYLIKEDLKLYYEIHGKGKPLLCLHGYTADTSSFSTVLKKLAENFQLILIDNRCSGKTISCNEKITILAMAKDIIDLLDELKIEKANILGHSMGSLIAQMIAFHFPLRVENLILAHSCFEIPDRTAFLMQMHLDFKNQKMEEDALAMIFLPWMMSSNFLRNYHQAKRAMLEMEKIRTRPTCECNQKLLKALIDFNSKNWFPKILAKTLLITGDEDLIFPAEQSQIMAKQMPHAQLKVFTKMAHMSHVEIPNEFVEVVVGFLRS